MTGISENVQVTSEDWRQFSEDFRTVPKINDDIPMTFEHLRFKRIVDIWKLLRLL